MGIKCGLLPRLTAAAIFFAGTSYAQDAQPLGDLARQHRQQAAATPKKDASASKVITNEEIPEQPDETPATVNKHGNGGNSTPSASNKTKQPAEYWKSRIQAQKAQIASVQKRIDEINSSIRFSFVNCGTSCDLRNERQRTKQQHVEQMQGQLQVQKRELEDTQDAARKQGYGSSVYDP
ncbi:MAG: hypothetical protein JWQ87_2388 [Candidatus Sulfotelmatobacter sp.]|nr:hypothetical protein [Candidatus Sulfotelmatobacter sp.]